MTEGKEQRTEARSKEGRRRLELLGAIFQLYFSSYQHLPPR
jgi:hypothetical protein